MTIEVKSHRAEVRRQMNMLKNVDEMQQLGMAIWRHVEGFQALQSSSRGRDHAHRRR